MPADNPPKTLSKGNGFGFHSDSGQGLFWLFVMQNAHELFLQCSLASHIENDVQERFEEEMEIALETAAALAAAAEEEEACFKALPEQ